MYKLRHTWTQYNIFSPSKLNQLDRRIQSIDPNWPVTAISSQPPPTKPSKILINPAKFPQVGIFYKVPLGFTHLVIYLWFRMLIINVADPQLKNSDPDPAARFF